MSAPGGNLDGITGRLGEEALLERLSGLEREVAARDARIAALEQGPDRNLKLLQAAETRMAALEADREQRLRLLRASEQRIAAIEQDRAERLELAQRLTQEVLSLRAEAALPMWKRMARRLTGKAPGSRPSPNLVQPSGGAVPAGEPPETTIFRLLSTDRALARLARRGVEVGTVIDVGASNGMWSAVCEKHYPNARYLLVEAQETHRAALEDYCRRRPQAAYVLAAAGPRLGEIWFDDSDPFGGLASERQTASMRRKVPVTTLDHEIASRSLPGPYLVKLDVHGFEVPILDGAVEALRKASLVVIECYCFRVAEGSLLFDEMVARMRNLGFGVLDVSEPLWRARDGSLWQMDFFFAPLTRPEFASNTWS